jgi:4-amino-4-deoxy-L-arabinose transferase-like glycosyltransferase
VENRPVPLRLLLLLALPVYLVALGANTIWDANEAFYVETPKQMVSSGDYIHPTFNGQPRENKPVLSYWIVAAFYHLFGISVAVERLAIALGALATIAGVFLMGRALSGPATGVLAALIFATAPRVVFFSRRIMIDVYLTLFLTLALACFAMALRSPGRRTRYLVAMYVAIALGFLTKGPIAIGLPGLVLVVWLITERRFADLRHLLLLPGALIVLAIAAPWYGALYASRGWEPLYDFFITENFGRYATAMTTSRPPWFFLPVLFLDILMPWAPLLVVPMTAYWRGMGAGGTGPDAEGAIRRLLWWWIVAIVLFFSMAASKEDLYIYPVMPAAAALIAHALLASRFGAADAGVRGILTGIGVLCVLLGAAVYWLLGSGYYALADAAVVALVLGAAGVGAAVLSMTRRGDTAVFVLAAGLVVMNYLMVARVIPSLERLKPVPALAQTLAARASPEAQVAYCNMDGLTSLVHYTGRTIASLDCVAGLDPAVQLLAAPAEAWVVTSEQEWSELRLRVPGACAAATHPLFVAKIEDLLERRPPPDVVLATNKCN